jgi:hypothetical protein
VLGSLTDRLPRILLSSRTREAVRSPTAHPISISREVLLFVVGCALAAALIGGASFLVVNGSATALAINDAEVITQIDARGIVAPLLTTALIAGNPAALSNLDAVVTQRVLSARVVRVKVWTATGKIVYSDAKALVGQTFAIGADEEAALDSGKTDADVSDLARPENRFERTFGTLVEVYLPVRAADGTKLLFETYQRDPGRPAAHLGWRLPGAGRRARTPLHRAGPLELAPGAPPATKQPRPRRAAPTSHRQLGDRALADRRGSS